MRYLKSLLWTVWWTGSALYLANMFFSWTSDQFAIAAFMVLCAVCMSFYLLLELPEKMQMRKNFKTQNAAAVLRTWERNLLDLSVKYLQRKDEQNSLGAIWQEKGPQKELMEWALRIRLQSLEDAIHCQRMKDLAISILDEPPVHLLELSAVLQQGYEMMSLWAPGDERLLDLLPDIGQLAPLTAKISQG